MSVELKDDKPSGFVVAMAAHDERLILLEGGLLIDHQLAFAEELYVHLIAL